MNSPSEFGTPEVSFDTRLGAMLGGSVIDIDSDALAAFYSGLPHDDKPSLDSVSIIFDSEHPCDGTITKFGSTDYRVAPGSSAITYDIRVHVGSCMAGLNGVSMHDKLNETVTHELTHVAQKDEMQILEAHSKEIEKRRINALYYGAARLVLRSTVAPFARTVSSLIDDGLWLSVGILAAVLPAAESSQDGTVLSFSTGLAAASLTHVLRHRLHRQRWIKRRQASRHQRYLNKPTEIDARQHEDRNAEIVFVD